MDNQVAGASEKVKIYKDDHEMEVFMVDAREICKYNGYSFEKPMPVEIKPVKRNRGE